MLLLNVQGALRKVLKLQKHAETRIWQDLAYVTSSPPGRSALPPLAIPH
jgi:hypothetical protein